MKWSAPIARVFVVLGVISGILSLSILLVTGLQLGFSEPADIVARYYYAILSFLLGWADPIIGKLIDAWGRIIGVDIQIRAKWKHTFMLLWLYFSANVRTNWKLGRRKFAAFSFLFGGVVALVFSIVSATIPASGTARIFAAILPMVGVITFELGRSVASASFNVVTPSFDANDHTWWQSFRYFFQTYGAPVGVAGVIVLIPMIAMYRRPEGFPELTLFGFIVLLAFVWLGRAMWLAVTDRSSDESLKERFHRSGSSKFGFLMLTTVIGTLLFLAANAGLQVVGL